MNRFKISSILAPDPTGKLFIPLAGMILALGAVWIYLTVAPPGETTSGLIPAPQAGFLAPDFTLLAAEGEPVTLSDLRGRPVLVNLWASWCSPCRAEMPAMQRLHEQYGDDFVILAVHMTAQDSEAAARAFAAEYGLTFPILFDPAGDVSRLYENRALPSSYFVDRAGVIREVVIGGPMAEAFLITRAETLLAQGDR